MCIRAWKEAPGRWYKQPTRAVVSDLLTDPKKVPRSQGCEVTDWFVIMAADCPLPWRSLSLPCSHTSSLKNGESALWG